MYISKKTGFFTMACQSRQVYLEEGVEAPGDISAPSLERLLLLGVVEKISEKSFVKETKDGKNSKTEKPVKPSKDVKPDAPADEPVE